MAHQNKFEDTTSGKNGGGSVDSTQNFKAHFHKDESKEHTIVHIDAPAHPSATALSKKVTKATADAKASTTEDTTPCHICCVIDVSGSMSTKLICKDETGEENVTGLSILDVVLYSALVVSRSLREKDMMSIVTFSDNAETELKPTFMDEMGKKKVGAVLKTICCRGRTNLWSGVERAFELSSAIGKSSNNCIFVLTDGLPNVDPPLGYEESFSRLLNETPVFGTLSTFGFGYNLNSSLLYKLSKWGGGYFSFIPDLGFVGTCFINSVANARCVFGLNPKLLIHTKKSESSDAKELKFITRDGELSSEEENNVLSIGLSPLRYGQSVDIVLNDTHFDQAETHCIELVFSIVNGHDIKVSVDNNDEVHDFSKQTDQFHLARTKFVREVISFLSSPSFDHDGNVFSTPAESEGKGTKKNNKQIDALVKDITGQASEAISSQTFFHRWGKHYLHSLSTAHLHQLCNNFKDPGVQSYGEGDLFRTLQEELNDIFDELPPPKKFQARPKVVSTAHVASRENVQKKAMSSMFNNRRIVCVHGDTNVIIKQPSSDVSGAPVPISKLQRGDLVATSDGTFVPVRCVIQTMIKKRANSEKSVKFVRLGEKRLLITPYHPVQLPGEKNKWIFPIDAKGSELVEVNCTSVFNLVLGDEEDGDHHRRCAVIMDGIPCITLGHGIMEGDVAPHTYFGTDAVLNDLASNFAEGWEKGHVVLHEDDVKRDPSSGNVCCIAPSM